MDRSQSLFGQPMLQSHAAIVVYEELLRTYEDSINWICEIGTGTGTLSIYWALWANLHKIPFLTIDNGAADWADWKPTLKRYETLLSLEARVIRGDCFKESRAEVSEFITGETGFLFCDGGKKTKELQMFAPLTALGSLIVAHDWPIEIDEEGVASVPEVDYFQPWHDQSLELKTKAAILVRK